MKKVLLLFLAALGMGSMPTDAAAQSSWALSYTPVVSSTNPVDTLVRVTAVLTLSDTSNVAMISFKAGNEMGAGDVFNAQYLFSQVNVQGAGSVSYTRNGTVVSITIGDLTYRKIYFEARLLDENENTIVTTYHEN